MSHSVDDIRADIAYMKEVVEGGGGSLRGGLILLAAGALFGGASLVGFAQTMGVLHLPTMAPMWLPLGAMALFFIALALVTVMTPSEPRTPANRAIGTVWSGVGWAIGALVLAGFGAMNAVHTSAVFALFSPVVLVLYGAAWMVSHAMTRQPFQLWISLGCYGAGVATGFLAASPFMPLVLALALFAFAAIPGALLVAKARR